MQHGGLSVDNSYAKFHEILIKNKRVLGPNRVNMNGNTFFLLSTVYSECLTKMCPEKKNNKKTQLEFFLVSEQKNRAFRR